MDDADGKPTGFKFYPRGDEYMLATDVAKYLNRPLSQLFALFPSMYRRKSSSKERAWLEERAITSAAVVTLVLASESEELMELLNRRSNSSSETPLAIIPTRESFVQPDKGYIMTRSVNPQTEPSSGLMPKFGRHCANVLSEYYKTSGGFKSSNSSEVQELVPIRLDVEHSGHKVKDVFCWAMGDKMVLPKTFAIQYCLDEELPNSIVALIEQSIDEQIEEFKNVSHVDLGTRVATIELNIQVGTTLLEDKFFWNHSEKNMSPENFAEIFCSEIGISGEFPPLVAHSIREQLLIDRKIAIHQDNSEYVAPFEIAEQKDCFRILSATNVDEWTPSLISETWNEVEKALEKADRDARRKKRKLEDDISAPAGRRSARARKDVSYVQSKNRSVGSVGVFRNNKISIDPTDRRAFPETLDTALEPASDAVKMHLKECRGVDLTADVNSDRALSTFNQTRRLVSNPFLMASNIHTGKILKDKVTFSGTKDPISGIDRDDERKAGMGDALGGEHEPIFVKPGYYKDNALNRKLGRVGQKKKPAGPKTANNP